MGTTNLRQFGMGNAISGWSRLRRRRPRATVLGMTVLIAVSALVLPPVWTLLHSSVVVRDGGAARSYTLEHYAYLISGDRLPISIWNSFVFSVSAMLLALALGGVIAWLVERTDVPLKRVAWVTAIVALGTPFILYVTAWIYLLGRAGPLNDIYRQIVGGRGVLFEIHSIWGMILVQGFTWSPLAFLLLSSTFRSANAEMEEAARMSGATLVESIRFISLRLARPTILAFALFVFILNLEAFEAPALIGMPGKVNVLTTEIYRSVKEVPPRVGDASAFSVVMLVIVSTLLYFYRQISRYAERYASITGKGYRPRPIRLGRARWWFASIIAVNFVIVLLLPLAAMTWMSLTKFVRPMRWEALGSITLDHFGNLFSSSYYGSLVFNTLTVAAGTASVTMFLTLLAGWMAARRQFGGQVVDQLIVIPLIFPGIVLGVAMLELALNAPVPVYGTLWLIGLAFVIHYLPFGMRYAYAGALQIHPELEQAAGVAGANTQEKVTRIVVPLLAPALVSGWLFVFLLASKEMSLPLLLAGSQSQTMSVAMFDLWGNGQIGEVAALGLLWATLMSFVGLVFFLFNRRRDAITFG